MAESTEAGTDVPLGSSIAYGVVPLESIWLSEESRRRPSRLSDCEKENRALRTDAAHVMRDS
jgi:hypothetical protein